MQLMWPIDFICSTLANHFHSNTLSIDSFVLFCFVFSFRNKISSKASVSSFFLSHNKKSFSSCIILVKTSYIMLQRRMILSSCLKVSHLVSNIKVECFQCFTIQFSSVQSLSRVRLFATP